MLPPSQELPQEITDSVIDFLHDDYQALATCSLVCRNWLARVRYHSFGHLNITHFRSHIRRPTPKNALTFLDLVQQNNTVLPYIHSVYISTDAHFAPIITALAASTPKRLDILFHDIPEANLYTLVRVPCLFQHLTDFTLTVPHVMCPEILQTISSFPSLRSLSLFASYSVRFDRVSAKDINIVNFAQLDTLRLQFRQSEIVCGWLLELGGLPRLTSFELGVYRCHHTGCGPVDVLNTFLSAHGISLEHLRISVQYYALGESRDTSPGELSIFFVS